ncbi:MAG: phosphotransferase family protein [Hyphomicrobiales bacterium]|nr:MAG: phosphotransferase family protein [Hyphomicrobiales bacterium]
MTDLCDPEQGISGQAMPIDPDLRGILEERRSVRSAAPYQPLSLSAIRQSVDLFLRDHLPGQEAVDVFRLGGGASKEQFAVIARDGSGQVQKYVVRADPLETVTVTDRRRENEVLRLVQGLIPAPEVIYLDCTRRFFDQPTIVMRFVEGVTKPANSPRGVTGIGVAFGSPLRDRLKTQFLDHLVALHGIDLAAASLQNFSVPRPNTKEATSWQLGYWSEIWRQDMIEEVPIISYVREWLTRNRPITARPVMLHTDYRTGNFLFDEPSGIITAILDWEMAHIGDFHEEVAQFLQPTTAVMDGGVWRANDMFERQEFLDAYAAASGRSIDAATLHYYELFWAYKVYICTVGTASAVARAQHSHQDLVLATLPGMSPLLLTRMCNLLEAA